MVRLVFFLSMCCVVCYTPGMQRHETDLILPFDEQAYIQRVSRTLAVLPVAVSREEAFASTCCECYQSNLKKLYSDDDSEKQNSHCVAEVRAFENLQKFSNASFLVEDTMNVPDQDILRLVLAIYTHAGIKLVRPELQRLAQVQVIFGNKALSVVAGTDGYLIFRCVHCFTCFCNYDVYVKHVQTTHPGQESIFHLLATKSVYFMCEKCGKTYNYEQLTVHAAHNH